jgi:hypothetical protein
MENILFNLKIWIILKSDFIANRLFSQEQQEKLLIEMIRRNFIERGLDVKGKTDEEIKNAFKELHRIFGQFGITSNEFAERLKH